jgi:hypothetical protein
MILGGLLERRSSVAEGPRFAIKGAVALEMRLLLKARATRDIDLVVDDLGSADPTAALRDALGADYQGFSFRLKGAPYVMPNESVRVQVSLDYRGRNWGTIQVDLSPGEGDRTEVEMVEPLGLDPFGLGTPDVLPCISLRYHIAQKIHAMTEPPIDGAIPNERFRDLVDLLLMRELTADLSRVRAACVDVFAMRAKHQWPPMLEPPAFWEQPFESLAEDVDLPVRSFGDAVEEVRSFIEAIERAG